MAPSRRAATPPKSRPIGSRQLLIGGIAVAITGIPFFFGPGLWFQEVGIGLICLGAGVAITVAIRRAVLDDVTAARGSKVAAAAAVIVLPHTLVFGAIGLGLIGFGLMLLAIALGIL